jgi:hypothetical protein
MDNVHGKQALHTFFREGFAVLNAPFEQMSNRESQAKFNVNERRANVLGGDRVCKPTLGIGLSCLEAEREIPIEVSFERR